MTLFKDLESRGIVKQLTHPELPAVAEKGPLTLYCGFDPTADSLHVGSLLPLLTLRRFQEAGHRVIALVGGATGMIGDPSGKSKERSLLDEAQIERNLAGIKKVIARFLRFDGPNPAVMANNGDWFKNLSYIDFLRDVGKHFTVNHMLAKESVRARLEDREHGISYTEFSYMLLQAYDFYVLNRDQDCRLQIGGSDQWGNITAGVELTRRIHAALHPSETASEPARETFGMTWPLVAKSDGTKFGKTEAGTLWLTPDRTSAYEFYQFFIQTADADVGTFLRYFTFLPLSEIERLEDTVKTAPEKREAQTTLARELTRLVHGQTELDRVEKATKALFSEEIKTLDRATLLSVFSGAPSTQKPRAALAAGIPLIDLLVESGLCASKGAARKDIAGNGISLNNERVTDPALSITEKNLIAGQFVVLRKGKKTYHLVSFE